jgi:outer membrane immunogenic protein
MPVIADDRAVAGGRQLSRKADQDYRSVRAGRQNTFTQLGWTAGIGVDWRVSGNWIARGEYRYAQFGSDGLLNLSVPTNTSTIGYHLRTSSNIATLGIAYQFGGPVVAKY